MRRKDKSRAALLPTPGDPYIVAAWLNLYKNVWKDEIDKLYVHFNSRLEEPVIKYSIGLAEVVGADCSYEPQWGGHGEALLKIFDRVTEDYVTLAEDDGYIVHKTVVGQCFSKIESGDYDAVVNLRASCCMALLEKEREFFGLTGEEWHKPHFWPCFFFSKRETLENTDKFFGCKNLYKDDVVQELGGWQIPADKTMVSADTFGWASLQLRAQGLKFFILEDGRSTTQDYWLYDQKAGIFANPPIAPWIHFGSTSSGISNSLLDDEMKPLENRTRGVPTDLPQMPDEHIADDYARRISLWQLCWEHFQIPEDNEAAYFNKIYGDALNRTIDGCGIDRNRLNKYKTIYTNALAPMWSKND